MFKRGLELPRHAAVASLPGGPPDPAAWRSRTGPTTSLPPSLNGVSHSANQAASGVGTPLERRSLNDRLIDQVRHGNIARVVYLLARRIGRTKLDPE